MTLFGRSHLDLSIDMKFEVDCHHWRRALDDICHESPLMVCNMNDIVILRKARKNRFSYVHTPFDRGLKQLNFLYRSAKHMSK